MRLGRMRLGVGLVLGLVVWVAWAQDPLVTLPGNYKVVFENAQVKVIRAHYGGRERIPVHDHPGVATVFVYLNDSGPVRIDHVDEGKVESAVRPPTVKGAFRVAPALAERHSIESLSDTDSEFLRVELKGVRLGLKEPFRGKAPASLAESRDEVEFSDPAVQVERIVCVGKAACAVKAAAVASLLVAVDPASVLVGAGAKEPLAEGSVRWLRAGQGAELGGLGSGAVEVLRILLPGR